MKLGSSNIIEQDDTPAPSVRSSISTSRVHILRSNESLRPSPRPPCKRLLGLQISGTGSYVPETIVAFARRVSPSAGMPGRARRQVIWLSKPAAGR
jgi:hypothetical protein